MKKILLFAVLVSTSIGFSHLAKADDTQTTDKQGEYVAVSTASLSGVNAVIKEQLQAIRERNDRIAFDLNTKTIQEDFKDPQSFMRDLRRKKKSLYNHVDYKFLDSSGSETKFHKVLLTDKYGKSSIAMFKMEKDETGNWKTNDIIILMSDDGPV